MICSFVEHCGIEGQRESFGSNMTINVRINVSVGRKNFDWR